MNGHGRTLYKYYSSLIIYKRSQPEELCGSDYNFMTSWAGKIMKTIKYQQFTLVGEERRMYIQSAEDLQAGDTTVYEVMMPDTCHYVKNYLSKPIKCTA